MSDLPASVDAALTALEAGDVAMSWAAELRQIRECRDCGKEALSREDFEGKLQEHLGIGYDNAAVDRVHYALDRNFAKYRVQELDMWEGRRCEECQSVKDAEDYVGD